ncbi:hypothetical protein AcV7_010424 [Taiwanofungus camphoratus]|nr:hypothetical protein AcV7_010444 [Antrodia cinnamomea]KAI0924853.1 hypothetical protein AcW2_010359 [Antrodia cinnamomea]KAI0953790.1 hypothetical protein AcV7_010424 [Antrodia cinnamomea]
MSPEILGGEPTLYFQGPEVPKHCFLHDLESFFWCLVWLCMSKDGARRRIELIPGDNQPKNKALRVLFAKFFEGPDELSVVTKLGIFQYQPSFTSRVLNNVTDYYRPLVPLLSSFYQILLDAYTDERQKLDIGIYNKVIAAFESTEERLNDQPVDATDEYCRLREKEDERRRQDRYGHWDHHSPKVGESAQDPASSSQDVLASSPIPARKRARLEAPPDHDQHSDRDDQPSNRGSSTGRGRRRPCGRASTRGQGRASNRDQTSNRHQPATGGQSSHSGQPSRGTLVAVDRARESVGADN